VSALLRTPLFELHQQLGGRMVDFAGFALPVDYGSIVSEHTAVRERAGVFDVSHMGQIELQGPGAVSCAERLLSCRVENLQPGRVRYGLLCNEKGGVVDDVTLYRLSPGSLMLCVNAANIEKDRRWIERHADPSLRVDDRSSATGMLAVQGPRSAEILDRLGAPESAPRAEAPALPSALGRFRFAAFRLADVPVRLSRTGYTGSDGFEIYVDAARTREVFEALLEKGEAFGLCAAGLGARDTLRLEAALPLYGHELDDDTSPLEAGLARFVKRERGGFIGADAIEAREARGAARRLVGFELEGRGIARAGHGIEIGGEAVGRVTSGAPSPSLGKSIGLGYVPPALAEPGARFDVLVRTRAIPARVVETPFV